MIIKNHKNDVTGEIKNELKAVRAIKGKMVFTNEITFSSSNLINYSTNFFLKSTKENNKKHF